MARNLSGDPRTQSELDGPSIATPEDDELPQGSWIGRFLRVVRGQPISDVERLRALRKAVRSQDYEEAEKLLMQGAISLAEDQEASLACIAARRSDFKMLDLLIRAGIDVNQADRRSRDHKSRTPLMEAARKGWDEGVDCLLAARAKTEYADETGSTALSLAVRGGRETTVRQLLKSGANPNGSATEHNPQLSPLHEAASESLAALLLENGANPNGRDRQNMTPLHYHARAGRLSVVKMLLEKGADVNALDRNLRSPIFVVGQKGDSLGTLEVLHQAQAKLDLVDKEENTFVHLVCARADDGRVFEKLAEWVPELFSRQNHLGETPRDILAVRGFREAATSLGLTDEERRKKGEFVEPARFNLSEAARAKKSAKENL